jgi:hypothetical protein
MNPPTAKKNCYTSHCTHMGATLSRGLPKSFCTGCSCSMTVCCCVMFKTDLDRKGRCRCCTRDGFCVVLLIGALLLLNAAPATTTPLGRRLQANIELLLRTTLIEWCLVSMRPTYCIRTTGCCCCVRLCLEASNCDTSTSFHHLTARLPNVLNLLGV